jgi:hypothetical protein
MLPVKSCGIGVICGGLAQSQKHDPGQVFCKFNVEAFCINLQELLNAVIGRVERDPSP